MTNLCPSCREPLGHPSGEGCAAMTKHQPIQDKCPQCAEHDALWENMERALEKSDAREAQLEAKLVKAVEAAFNEGFLAGTADGWVNNPRIKMEWKRSRARTTLAELKG